MFKKIASILIGVFMLANLVLISIPAGIAAPTFKDIPSSHWARQYINYMVDKRYISGYSDGTFRPAASMSRGLFVTVVIKMLGITPTDITTVNFSDTANYSGKAYINEAVKRGIIVKSEYSGVFNPNGAIKRSEAATILVRALGKAPDNGTITFQDRDDVEKSLYRGYIKEAYDLGLITCFPNGEFKPFAIMDRAQACTILYRFASQLGNKSTTPVTSGNIKYIYTVTVAGKQYTLGLDPMYYKSGYTNTTVNSISLLNNNIYLNNSYQLASNNSEIIIYNKCYKLGTAQVSGNSVVIYPESLRLDSVTIDGSKYDTQFVKLYIDKKYGDNSLEDLEILDDRNVRINGKYYDINTTPIAIEAGYNFYEIDKIRISDKDITLDLSKTDPVVVKNLDMANIGGIYIDDDLIKGTQLEDICFIIDHALYELNEVAIDSSGNITIDDQIYSPDKVTLLIDLEYYELTNIRQSGSKFYFYAENSDEIYLVKINNSFVDPDLVKIMKDSVAYDIEDVIVIKDNRIRIGGREYTTSDLRCRWEDKVYSIKEFNFDVDKNLYELRLSSSAINYSSTGEPRKYVFYRNSTLYLDGDTDDVLVYVKGKWVDFDDISFLNPVCFDWNGYEIDFIDLKIRIDDTDFIVTDTVWRGSNNVFEIYMQKV